MLPALATSAGGTERDMKRKRIEAELRLNRLRGELRGLTTAETRDAAAILSKSREVEEAEGAVNAALQAELDGMGEDEQPVSTPETRERAELRGRARLGRFLEEAVIGRRITDGPEAELRAEVLPGSPEIGGLPLNLPLVMLDEPETETRAVTPVAAAAQVAEGHRGPLLRRIFDRSVANRLGVAMPRVPVGEARFPVMTAGAMAEMKAESADTVASAGAFTGHDLTPHRLSAAIEYTVEASLSFPNLEGVLRNDMAAVMTEQMDNQILVGSGAGANVTGFFSELPAPGAAVARLTWAGAYAAFAGLVDGKTSFGTNDIASVIGQDTFAHLATLYPASALSTAPQVSAWDYLATRTGAMVISNKVPAVANKRQTVLYSRTSYPGQNAVAPVWQGMSLIRDPYSGAGKAEVKVVAHAFFDFKVLREQAFGLLDWQIQA